ncbi:MAG: ornithine carbamoyltransferase [Opitutales bacterium]
MRHFLQETDFTTIEASDVFAAAAAFKSDRFNTPSHLNHQSWGILFYKNSTRTRVSFEVGIHELGGRPIVLTSQDTQMGRGESISDTAKVLSRYLHGLVIRTFDHAIIEDFARFSKLPVVNGLTDLLHPCQTYSDLFTLLERWSPKGAPDIGKLRGRKIAFLGDTASNMANSWILAAAHFGMELSLAGPASYAPGEAIHKRLQAEDLPETHHFTTNPKEAVKNADVVYTDIWVSMGVEEDAQKRKKELQPYSVTAPLMQEAKPDACFMHCLPAHPGEEVSQEVLDSPASIIFDQAENRLHTQKAILSKLVALNAETGSGLLASVK